MVYKVGAAIGRNNLFRVQGSWARRRVNYKNDLKLAQTQREVKNLLHLCSDLGMMGDVPSKNTVVWYLVKQGFGAMAIGVLSVQTNITRQRIINTFIVVLNYRPISCSG